MSKLEYCCVGNYINEEERLLIVDSKKKGELPKQGIWTNSIRSVSLSITAMTGECSQRVGVRTGAKTQINTDLLSDRIRRAVMRLPENQELRSTRKIQKQDSTEDRPGRCLEPSRRLTSTGISQVHTARRKDRYQPEK